MANAYFSTSLREHTRFVRHLTEYLDGLQLDVPIRGTMDSRTDLTTWNSRWAGGCDTTIEEANETGITLAFSRVLTPSIPRTDISIPNALDMFTAEESGYEEGRVYLYDALSLTEGNCEYEPLTFTSSYRGNDLLHLLGEYDVDTRTIGFVFGPNSVMASAHGSIRWEDIIGEAIEVLTGVGSLTPEERNERRMAQYRDRFAELLQGRHEDRLRQERTHIEQLMGQMADARTTVARTASELREAQAMYDVVTDRLNAGTGTADVEREWAALYRHADTREVRVQGTVVTVRTAPLTLTRPDTGASIIVGEFDVAMDFGPTPSLKANNLTNRRGVLDHPHVHNGRFCLGNLEETVHTLLGRRDVATAYNLVVEALKNVTPEDVWGASVSQFFNDAASEVLADNGDDS